MFEEALPAKLALFMDLPASGVGEGEAGLGPWVHPG